MNKAPKSGGIATIIGNPPIECYDCDSLKCVKHDITVDTKEWMFLKR